MQVKEFIEEVIRVSDKLNLTEDEYYELLEWTLHMTHSDKVKASEKFGGEE